MEEEDPHNYRAVGWSMVAVAAGLAGIGLLALFIGDDVLYSDNFQRAKDGRVRALQDDRLRGGHVRKVPRPHKHAYIGRVHRRPMTSMSSKSNPSHLHA